ncbi:MATE family efflux transporter [bacterium]|nr:MATE family efflux transporter [bacterium]
MKKIDDLTKGSIHKSIWKLALPIMISVILHNAFNIVDMIFVGKLGPEAIAAVAMGGIFFGIIMIALIGISIGTTAMIARAIGAKNTKEAEDIAVQSLFMGVVGSIVLGLSGFFLAKPMLILFGASGEVISLGASYIRILSLGSITMFLLFLISAILRGAGDAFSPMKFLMLSTGLNIVLDPILIFGMFEVPALGVKGSALATVIARAAGVIWGLWAIFRGHSVIHLKIRESRLRFSTMLQMIRTGIFAALQMAARNISGLILMRIVAIYGTFAVAAYGIGMRVLMLVMMPGFAFAQCATTLVGQNLGADKPRRAEKSAWLSAGFFGIMSIIFAIIFFIFAKEIIAVFNTNQEVIRIGVLYLRFLSFTFVFMASSIVLGRAFMGAGDTLSPLIITGISLFGFQIPLALLLSRNFNMNTNGIWLAIAISNIVQGVMMAGWFKKGKWKNTLPMRETLC